MISLPAQLDTPSKLRLLLQVDDERVAEELFREQAGSAASHKTAERAASLERDDRWGDIYEVQQIANFSTTGLKNPLASGIPCNSLYCSIALDSSPLPVSTLYE